MLTSGMESELTGCPRQEVINPSERKQGGFIAAGQGAKTEEALKPVYYNPTSVQCTDHSGP